MKKLFLSLLEQFLIIPVAKINFFNLIISSSLKFLIYSLTFLFNDLKRKEIQKTSLSIHWLKTFIENILNFKPLTSLLLASNLISYTFIVTLYFIRAAIECSTETLK